MLDWYIVECMVSIININNGIKEPTRGIQNCSTSQIMIFGGYVKVQKSLSTRVIIRVDIILNFIILGRFYLGIKVLACYIDVNGIENKNTIKYPYLLVYSNDEIGSLGALWMDIRVL